MQSFLSRVDWSHWGPLTILVVVSVVTFELLIGAYLVIAQPPLADVKGLVVAVAALLGSPAVLGVAHAIVSSGEKRADAIREASAITAAAGEVIAQPGPGKAADSAGFPQD